MVRACSAPCEKTKIYCDFPSHVISLPKRSILSVHHPTYGKNLVDASSENLWRKVYGLTSVARSFSRGPLFIVFLSEMYMRFNFLAWTSMWSAVLRCFWASIVFCILRPSAESAPSCERKHKRKKHFSRHVPAPEVSVPRCTHPILTIIVSQITKVSALWRLLLDFNLANIDGLVAQVRRQFILIVHPHLEVLVPPELVINGLIIH